MGAFHELGSIDISKTRTIVLSRTGDGKFSLAQRVAIGDVDEHTNIYLKGALVLSSENMMRVGNLIRDILSDVAESQEEK